jgi:hypothetical protein
LKVLENVWHKVGLEVLNSDYTKNKIKFE